MSLTKIAELHRIEPRAEVFSLVPQTARAPVPAWWLRRELTTDDGIYNVSKLDGETPGSMTASGR